MMRYSKMTIGIVAVLGLGLVLAQGDEEEDITSIDLSDAPPAAEEGCFNVRDVRNFEAFTDGYVYVEGRRDEHYLLTMFSACIGLRGAIGIAISNRMSRVCSNSSASITYRGLGRVESCRIRTVEQVESKDAAEAVTEIRTQRD